MIKNKSGFSLLTVMIGLTLGSIISIIVLQAISQLSSTLGRATALTQTDINAFLGIKVLEHDLSCLCMPEYIYFKEKKTAPKSSDAQSQEADKAPGKEYFKNAFVIKQSPTILESVSCISMYSISKDHIAPKKVVYTLEKDKEDSATHTLYRQEFNNLVQNAKENSGLQKFIVMKNIISLKCILWARPILQEEQKDNKQTVPSSSEPLKEPKKEPYKSFEQWDSHKNYSDRKNKESFPLLPDYIDITVILQQDKKREVTYTTTVMTPAGFPELTIDDVAVVQHDKKSKDKQNPYEQLNALSNETELNPFLTDKVSHFAQNFNFSAKDKR